MTMLACRWDGEALVPMRGFQARADQDLVIGEVYTIETVEDRSAASHRHYFAALNDIWHSLPEGIADQFPTVEHLRKRCLIAAGYYDERTTVCSSAAEARRIAAFIRPIDEFSVVSVAGTAVVHRTAKSQSMRAMGKQVFQQSKDAILAEAEKLISPARGRDAA